MIIDYYCQKLRDFPAVMSQSVSEQHKHTEQPWKRFIVRIIGVRV